MTPPKNENVFSQKIGEIQQMKVNALPKLGSSPIVVKCQENENDATPTKFAWCVKKTSMNIKPLC